MNYLEASKTKEAAIDAFGLEVVKTFEEICFKFRKCDAWDIDNFDRFVGFCHYYYMQHKIADDRNFHIPEWITD